MNLNSMRPPCELILTVTLLCALAIQPIASRTHYNDRYDTTSQFAAGVLATSVKLTNEARVDRISATGRRPSPETYNFLRDTFFRYEESKALGADIELNDQELAANQIIMNAKIREYEEGLVTPHLFNPSQHIFSVLDRIRESPLYHYMSIMPKGGVLHAHDTALCSTDFLIKLTYRDKLWACQAPNNIDITGFRYAHEKPTIDMGDECEWSLLSDMRAKYGEKAIDDYLEERFTLFPTEKFLDINYAWQEFSKIFGLLDGLLMYAPNWGDYYYNALEEFHSDGVQYLELRTTLPILYDMDGTVYTPLDTVRIYSETLDTFLSTHPNFIGSKFIYAPLRNVDDEGFAEYVRICIEVKEKYPGFFAGFDLVGQEELGRPLRDFIPQLLEMPDDIDFYFHAGETNFYGSSIDENLIDAVLLGTKRIGHGFALVKHPVVLQMLKERNIAIEVNPVSNQVLQLVSDYRNHPCSHLFADNYPVVISSDDPSFWKASPLSHDYYMAFLGIASAHADIRLLKKLAMNSIQYSAMSDVEKAEAMTKWQAQWDAFIQLVVTGETNAADRRLQTNRLD